MDAIDTFRSQATQNMATTVQALEGQVQRAKPYLERSLRNQGVDATTSAQFQPPQQRPGIPNNIQQQGPRQGEQPPYPHQGGNQ